MTYLKTLPTLTVKQQASAITKLVTKFLEDLGFEYLDSDYGRDHIFENSNGDQLTYYAGYFGANSEPQIFGNWYKGDDIDPLSEEAVNQVDTYLSELKKSIIGNDKSTAKALSC